MALLQVSLPRDKVPWRKAPSLPPPERCQGSLTRQTGAAASRLAAGTCPCPPWTPGPGLGTGFPEPGQSCAAARCFFPRVALPLEGSSPGLRQHLQTQCGGEPVGEASRDEEDVPK